MHVLDILAPHCNSTQIEAREVTACYSGRRRSIRRRIQASKRDRVINAQRNSKTLHPRALTRTARCTHRDGNGGMRGPDHSSWIVIVAVIAGGCGKPESQEIAASS